jgi:hypothetical protein
MTETKNTISDLINKLNRNNQKQTTNFVIKKPSKDILIQMLQREEEIRLSAEYINKCTEVASEPNGWLRISAEVQKQVAAEFGYISEIENDIAINQMRRAQYIYPDEPLFRTIPVYVRNNLAAKGKYLPNDIVPDIILHHSNDTYAESESSSSDQISLYQTFDNTRPNVLIASSHT